MCGRGSGKDNGQKKRRQEGDGFELWGGYMAAKRAKLLQQFHADPIEKETDIFAGVKIMINGLTHPPAHELKDLMAKHGGEWHMYQTSATTHIIASNLPNTKIKHLGAVPIVKPAWITESIGLGKLLDYKRYLLYTNQSSKQPALNFPVINKPSAENIPDKDVATSLNIEDKEFRKNHTNSTSLRAVNECGVIGKDVVIDDDIERRPYSNCDNVDGKAEINNAKNKDENIDNVNNAKNGEEDSDEDLFKDDDFNVKEHSKTTLAPPSNSHVDNVNTSKVSEIADAPKSAFNPATSKITKTASDPRFLEEFYNNSRLHLISTLGAEFKHLVGQLRDKSDGKFPGREKLAKEKGKTSALPLPQSVVMHIDMDCFFVSVGLRNHSELRGKPVAITHARSGTITSNDPAKEAEKQANRLKEFEMYTERLPEGAPSRVVDIKEKIDGLASMSEIASCSYEARKCGIKNGMFMGQAIKLCPDLKTLPYDFEGYKEVSNILYKAVASYTLDIEAVSCDEMYVDVKSILADTGLSVEEWASHIRQEIMDATGCPCSTGFGANRLQARLATRKAKPAGQYYLQPDDVEDYMSSISLEDLPGVGRATLAKLKGLELNTCGDVQGASLRLLQSELGNKLGEKIKDQSFGRDNVALNFHHERKSVSAEVNYGIRFKTKEECYSFLQSLSQEVFNRLSDINMNSRCLTLKLLVRAEGAPVETAKFLGHGVCDALSKSTTSNQLLSDANAIYREAKALYDKLNVPYAELRGVGIQLTKLGKNAPVNKALSNFLKLGAVKKGTTNSKPTFDQEKEPANKNPEIVAIEKEKCISINKSTNKKNKNTPVPQTKLTSFLSHKKADKIPNNQPIDITPRKTENQSILPAKSKNIPTTKSKRGRPKGSKNGDNTTRNGTNVSKIGHSATNKGKSVVKNLTMQGFLGIKQNQDSGRPETIEELSRPVEQIDMDVFNELPPEIREEVMREYNFKPSENPNFSISINMHKTEKNNMEKRVCLDKKKNEYVLKNKESVKKQETTNKKNEKTSPFENLSWDKIKPIIKVWVKSEPVPNYVDVEMLAKHFRLLAVDRKIEILKTVFNFLHRIFSGLNCSWHQAYFTLVNIMQKGVVESYGLVLLVSTAFDCCQIH